VAETVAEILEAYRTSHIDPTGLVARCFQRLRAYDDPAMFISLREQAAMSEAAALASTGNTGLPLYGIPVAVKDNVDVAGLPTTAGCPAYARMPTQDATAVARLKQAGAIIIGKTNLDQFATGLVGFRSPYGTPRNPFNPRLIPGGSSSGSGVAVAAGIVPLSLGTDTAGSGRVPASMNNIVGLKPSVGLVSAAGVDPACKSLDCVSIFALTADDAFAALEVMAGPDRHDPFSRAMRLGTLGDLPAALRLAVPRSDDLVFFGDKRAEAAFETALQLAQQLGATITEISLAPFFEAARLLYDGPWVAERYAAVGDFIAAHPDDIHPVTRKVISSGNTPSAVDAFRGLYRLMELRAETSEIMAKFDALMVPAVPAAYTIAEVEADPIEVNSRLGTYTNFVNLLDFAAASVPAAMAADGTPFGITFIAPAGHDAHLASLGRAFHASTGLPLGASKRTPSPLKQIGTVPRNDEIAVAVVGAHLSGMPLNGELRQSGARFLETTVTSPDYKLFELSKTNPPKPGLLRIERGAGAGIEVEIWALRADAFGRFVDAIPSPMSIGAIELHDGRCVKGFLTEAAAVTDARDISDFGGWRAFTKRSLASA
jgi:allophanate hydrolase